MSTRTRAASAAVLALVGTFVMAGPAFAADNVNVMEQDPATMSWGQAVLTFLLLPLGVVAIVWLLVSAPSWTRGGRVSDADAWTGDPLVIDSAAAPVPAPELEASEPVADSTGGTSAGW